MTAKDAKLTLIVVAVAVHGYANIVGPVLLRSSSEESLHFVGYAVVVMLPSLCSIVGGALIYWVVRARESRLTAVAWGAGTSAIAPCFAVVMSVLPVGFTSLLLIALVTVAAPLAALWLSR